MRDLASFRPFRLGRWQVWPDSRTLFDGNIRRVVRPKPMAVLCELAGASPGVATREALLRSAWPDVIVGDESLTHAVSELRRALGDQSRKGGLIETVQKSGYRLRVRPVWQTVRGCGGADDDMALEAHLVCLEARRIRERSGKGALREALELCREAAAMAPDAPAVQAEYALSVSDSHLYSPDARPDLPVALDAADRALELRTDLACGHVARGTVFEAMGDLEAARAAFLQAIGCEPGNAIAHYLMARMLYAAGDMRRAALLASEAARLREDDYCAPYLASGAFFAVGDETRAKAAAMMALDRLARRRASDGTEQRAQNILGSLLARLGRFEEARAEIAQYEAAGGLVTYYNAAGLAWLGEVDVALDRLEENLDTGYRNFRWIRHDPALASLRNERRFRAIVEAAGLEEA